MPRALPYWRYALSLSAAVLAIGIVILLVWQTFIPKPRFTEKYCLSLLKERTGIDANLTQVAPDRKEALLVSNQSIVLIAVDRLGDEIEACELRLSTSVEFTFPGKAWACEDAVKAYSTTESSDWLLMEKFVKRTLAPDDVRYEVHITYTNPAFRSAHEVALAELVRDLSYCEAI